MRRLALISVIAAAALAAPSAAAAAPAGPVSTAIDSCVAAGPSAAGSVQLRSEMSAIPRSARMAVRFDLQIRRQGDNVFRPVIVRDNGWIRSDPRVDTFIWHKLFGGLTEPGDYRARVRFRWYDARGKIVGATSRRTPVCAQPDVRPNLTLTALAAEPANEPGQLRYLLTLRNRGKSDAPPFDVSVSVAGAQRMLVTVSGVGAGRTQTVAFTGARCRPGETVRLEADPADRIAEADEADNVLTADCPVDVRR